MNEMPRRRRVPSGLSRRPAGSAKRCSASAQPLSAEAIASRLPGAVPAMQRDPDLAGGICRARRQSRQVAGKWAFRTADDLAFLLSRDVVEQRKLSRAALETLAIVAYHQPVTRAEIEEIRGVATSKGHARRAARNRLGAPARPAQDARPAGDLRHDRRGFLDHFGLEAHRRPAGARRTQGRRLHRGPLPPGFRRARAHRRSGACARTRTRSDRPT